MDETLLQKKRMWDLLAPHVTAEDRLLSNAEFVYQLAGRYRVEWTKQQALIDPHE
jgi:hypothetical protein